MLSPSSPITNPLNTWSYLFFFFQLSNRNFPIDFPHSFLSSQTILSPSLPPSLPLSLFHSSNQVFEFSASFFWEFSLFSFPLTNPPLERPTYHPANRAPCFLRIPTKQLVNKDLVARSHFTRRQLSLNQPSSALKQCSAHNIDFCEVATRN